MKSYSDNQVDPAQLQELQQLIASNANFVDQKIEFIKTQLLVFTVLTIGNTGLIFAMCYDLMFK